MGACTFFTISKGKTARDAFESAREDAKYRHGHNGYTGTIAEKGSFTVIAMPDSKIPTLGDAQVYADKLIDEGDKRINEKWGPAGCIQVEGEHYLFFGWARE